MRQELLLRFLFALLFLGTTSTTGAFAFSGEESSRSLWIDAPKTIAGRQTTIAIEKYRILDHAQAAPWVMGGLLALPATGSYIAGGGLTTLSTGAYVYGGNAMNTFLQASATIGGTLGTGGVTITTGELIFGGLLAHEGAQFLTNSVAYQQQGAEFVHNTGGLLPILPGMMPVVRNPAPIRNPARLLPAPRGANPDLAGAPIIGLELPKGFKFNQAVGPGQNSPGAFGTLDHIPSVDFVRGNLAVIPEWKPVISGSRAVEVTRPVRAQWSYIGPQTAGGVTYPGGGWQIRILEYDPKNPFVRFIGDETPLK